MAVLNVVKLGVTFRLVQNSCLISCESEVKKRQSLPITRWRDSDVSRRWNCYLSQSAFHCGPTKNKMRRYVHSLTEKNDNKINSSLLQWKWELILTPVLFHRRLYCTELRLLTDSRAWRERSSVSLQFREPKYKLPVGLQNKITLRRPLIPKK